MLTGHTLRRMGIAAPRPIQLLKFVTCSVALFLLFSAAPASAHPISLMSGAAQVHRDKIDLKVEIMPEDFMLIYGLYADGADRVTKSDIEQSAEKHKAFLLRSIVIRDEDGNALTGRITNMTSPSLPVSGLSVNDLTTIKFTYNIEYPLAKAPRHLTFQLKVGEAMSVPAVLTLSVAREGLPAEPNLQLSDEGNVETLAFDWPETAHAAASSGTDVKALQEQRQQKETGITSYAATYAFVYIQDDEVRVEILMPVVTLETWLPIPRADKDFLEVAEQTAAHNGIGEFFTSQNELKIDGVPVKPTLGKLDFYGVDANDFAMATAPRRLSAWTARVGAILTYSTKGAPRHVDLKWTLFNVRTFAARGFIFAYGKESHFTFVQDTPVYHWDNPGSPALPAVNAVPVDTKSREEVAESLLRNVYRAFDYHTESDIYDALARSAQGDLLADLYLKIKQGLIVQEQGGANAHVRKVTIIKAEPLDGGRDGGFRERVTWQAEGTVEHWGHVHTRVNEYWADLDITPVDRAWIITAMRVGRQSLVRSAVSLSGQ